METLATHSSVPIEIVNVIFTLWMDFSCTAIQSFEWSQGGWGSLPPIGDTSSYLDLPVIQGLVLHP